MRYITYMVVILLMLSLHTFSDNSLKERALAEFCQPALDEPIAHTEDFLKDSLYQRTTVLDARLAAAKDQLSVLQCTNHEIQLLRIE